MKPGQPSQTAALVCVARAFAHERALAPKFSDPTAFELLSEADRARVAHYRDGPPKESRARAAYEFIAVRAAMMAVRTIFIDEAIREASSSQVVILGAGLDGRAWRMPELGDAIVFEVDHPDSQREKRARLGSLRQTAREVRFVPVDFTRDDLSHCLAAAGHDATRPTTWIWEGVIMYLSRAEVEATLRLIAQRSVAGSRLVALYIARGHIVLRTIAALMLRRMGEPVRSRFSEREMHTLLAKYGFLSVLDEDLPTAAERLAPALRGAMKRIMHLRMVLADFR
ncbi:MAG TPA: class I SAM-dependent methyltransferase [Polyangiaceae bacterium]